MHQTYSVFTQIDESTNIIGLEDFKYIKRIYAKGVSAIELKTLLAGSLYRIDINFVKYEIICVCAMCIYALE